jgi:hypothetical protein
VAVATHWHDVVEGVDWEWGQSVPLSAASECLDWGAADESLVDGVGI